MNTTINLIVHTPYQLILEKEIKKITFRGLEGVVTILPNHIDYVSVFNEHIITYLDTDDIEKYILVNDGVFVKSTNNITVSTYQAILSDNINGLQKIRVENQIQNNINNKKFEDLILSNYIVK